jgi:hypothetical protein
MQPSGAFSRTTQTSALFYIPNNRQASHQAGGFNGAPTPFTPLTPCEALLVTAPGDAGRQDSPVGEGTRTGGAAGARGKAASCAGSLPFAGQGMESE